MILCEKAWTDHCGHPPDSYVGSFILYTSACDVYIFDSHGLVQSVCIRYGEEPSEYYSLPSIRHLVDSSSAMVTYSEAVNLLERYGKIKFVRNGSEDAEAKLEFLKSKGITVGKLKDGHSERWSYDIAAGSELDDHDTVVRLAEIEAQIEEIRRENIDLKERLLKIRSATDFLA